MEEVRLVTDSLREEAKKWRRLSDEMEQVKQNVERLDLAPTAFVPSAMAVVNAFFYSRAREWMTGLLAEAAAEFDQIGAALNRAADLYECTDEKSAQDLSAIYGKKSN